MSALRVAVVGVGYLGRLHARKYQAVEGARLVGVCDVDPSAGRECARALDVPFVTDYRELAGLVDAVTIAADTSVHYALTRFFLEHGVHVFVEKPIAQTSAEARELAELADARSLKLQVGHIERFNPALLSVREGLTNVRFVECHRLAPFKARGADVNVVLDLMIHDLDVILALIDAAPALVSAVGISVLTDMVDIANARIEFDNGAIANVTASRVSTSPQRKFRVFQRNQYVSIDFGRGEVQRVTRAAGADSPPLRQERWSLDKGDALLAETAAFVDAIRNGTPCVVSGWDGRRALALAETIIGDIDRRRPQTAL